MSRRRIPRTALALDAQATDRRFRGRHERRVLLVGELPVSERVELTERGAVLTTAADTHQAFVLLASVDFDVVAVEPRAPGNGLDLVTAVKENQAAHLHTLATLYGVRGGAPFLRGARAPDEAVLASARERHRVTPFVVLPLEGEDEYAIIVVPPDASFIENRRRLPVTTSIMRVDASKLLATVNPMA